MTAELVLHRDSFLRERRLLVRHGHMEAYIFRFPSGVEAIEIVTGKSRFVLLPFQATRYGTALPESGG